MMKLIVIAGGGAIGLVAILGLYLFVKGARNVQRAVASTGWPTTKGLVVRSDTTDSLDRTPETGEVSESHSTKTIIRYDANGKTYTTDVIHFGQTLGSSDASEAALQRIRYPVGSEVVVSYDPRAPWIAAIRPGLHGEAFWLPGAALAFLLPAVMCLAMGPTIMRTAREGGAADAAFQSAVHRAMEDAARGVAVPDRLPVPPPGGGGSAGIAIAARVFAGVFCALGILALAGGMQKVWRGWASESWPKVPGEVVFTRVGANVQARSERDGDNSTSYSPEFVYQYSVAGKKHVNNVRRFGGVQGAGEEWAREIASRYPMGKKVSVAYFPTDPDVSVLEPGNGGDAFWLPGIGVVLLLFSLATFYWVVPALAKS